MGLLVGTSLSGCIDSVSEDLGLSSVTEVAPTEGALVITLAGVNTAGWNALSATIGAVTATVGEEQDVVDDETTLRARAAKMDLSTRKEVELVRLTRDAAVFRSLSLRFDSVEGTRTLEDGSEETVIFSVEPPAAKVDRLFEVVPGATTTLILTLDVRESAEDTDAGPIFEPTLRGFRYMLDSELVDEADLVKIAVSRQVLAQDKAKPSETGLAQPRIVITDAEGRTVKRAEVDQPLTFRAAFESADEADKVLNFIWAMGDGNKYDGQEASHTFRKPGARLVVLKIEDAFGHSEAAEALIGVTYRASMKETGLFGVPPEARQQAGERAFKLNTFPAEDGAASIKLVLTYEPQSSIPQLFCVNPKDEVPDLPDSFNRTYCAGPVPYPVDNLLYLSVRDPSGAEVAKVTDASNPKIVELPTALAGTYTVRVDAENGFAVGYTLDVAVYYA